jgi:hypothetical protein
MSAMFRVTAKTATTVTVMPPLPIDFTQSLALVQYGISPLTIGFPNMGNNGFSKTWGPTTPPDYRAQAANQADGDSHGTGGNTLQELDLNVKNTMLRHGNYDYLNHSIGWDAAIADHAIPPSHFRSSKPVWFGNLPWPPFGIARQSATAPAKNSPPAIAAVLKCRPSALNFNGKAGVVRAVVWITSRLSGFAPVYRNSGAQPRPAPGSLSRSCLRESMPCAMGRSLPRSRGRSA